LSFRATAWSKVFAWLSDKSGMKVVLHPEVQAPTGSFDMISPQGKKHPSPRSSMPSMKG